jgi:hypothetical protein
VNFKVRSTRAAGVLEHETAELAARKFTTRQKGSFFWRECATVTSTAEGDEILFAFLFATGEELHRVWVRLARTEDGPPGPFEILG